MIYFHAQDILFAIIISCEKGCTGYTTLNFESSTPLIFFKCFKLSFIYLSFATKVMYNTLIAKTHFIGFLLKKFLPTANFGILGKKAFKL